jgi:chemotaxis protein MotB
VRPGLETPAPRPATRSPGWLLTLADLLSLLLAFFVLLFAATSVQQDKWHRLVQPIAAYMTGRGTAGTGAAGPGSTEPPGAPARDSLSYDGVLLRRLLAADTGLSGISLDETPHLIRLTLPAGSDLSRAGALAQLLGRLDNRVDVVVHVAPVAGGAAAASWRDGVLRALQIAAALRRDGDFRPITCISLAGASELAATGDAAGTGAAAAEILIHDTAPPAAADTDRAG